MVIFICFLFTIPIIFYHTCHFSFVDCTLHSYKKRLIFARYLLVDGNVYLIFVSSRNYHSLSSTFSWISHFTPQKPSHICSLLAGGWQVQSGSHAHTCEETLKVILTWYVEQVKQCQQQPSPSTYFLACPRRQGREHTLSGGVLYLPAPNRSSEEQ